MKLKIPLVIIFFLLGIYSVVHIVSVNNGIRQDYDDNLQLARSNAEQNLPYIARQYYVKALNIDASDSEVYKEYLEQLSKLNGISQADAWRGFINHYPDLQEGYDNLGDVYYNSEDYRALYNLINEANSAGMLTDKLLEYYKEIYYKYTFKTNSLLSATSFIGNYGIITNSAGYNYYILSSGKMFETESEYLGVFGDNGRIPAKIDGEFVYIDSTQNVVARLSRPVDYLGTYRLTGAVVAVGGKYGYTDGALNIPDKLEYDYATDIVNGVGAVKKNNTWALINENHELITDFIYTDIKLTDVNACIAYGVIFARKDDKYIMLDKSGNRIGELEFEDACMFADDNSPAAVKINGKWGFVNADGTMKYEPQFMGAGSFSLGMAPATNGLDWGYIAEKNGELAFVINPAFQECKPFTSNGCAAVRDGDTWGYILLFTYQ